MLRYLTDAYKALKRTVPEEAKTEELHDLTEWLGEPRAPGRLSPPRRVGAAAHPEEPPPTAGATPPTTRRLR